MKYGSFGRRVVAFVVDAVVVVVAAFGVLITLALAGGFVAGLLDTSEATDDRFIDRTIGPLMLVLLVVMPLAYSVVLEALPSQATLGKLLMKLKVTDIDGKRLSWRRSLARSLAKVASLLPGGLGFLPAAATERRQALHDMLVGTVVIRSDSEPRTSTAPTLGEADDELVHQADARIANWPSG